MKNIILALVFIIPSCIGLYYINKDLDNKYKNRNIRDNLDCYTRSEIELVARVINAEVENCTDIDRIAVGSSIVNRVDDPNFKGTIYDVVYRKNQYAISNHFTNHEYQIAKCILAGDIRQCDVLYFHKSNASNKKHINNIKKTKRLVLKTNCHEYYY